MKIIVVDDEQHALTSLGKALKEISGSDEIELFDRGKSALEYAEQNKIDVAFLDISMPEIHGIDLAKRLKKINPSVNVVFCTGYSEFMSQAINMHASGYLLKPVDKRDVKYAIENLLYPTEKPIPHFYARTFGNFDFFVDGTPIRFKRSKSKEMLAFLISIRGATANRKELSAILFGDKYDAKTQDYLTKIFKDLASTLKEFGAEKIIRKDYNSYSVDTEKFCCDLYDYDKGVPSAINEYKGEFMIQYEWAVL